MAGFALIYLLQGGTTALAGDGGTPQGNVFSSSAELPLNLKRVLVLPLACDQFAGTMADGCKMLSPALNAELIKTGRFEVADATPEVLRRCTGQLSWTGQEVLPADFFSSLRDVYGCDGVLFCQLTVFRPDPPLAVGWRLKLVDAATGTILWASDEIFDANNLETAKSAKEFERRRQPHQGIGYDIYSFFGWCLNSTTKSALDDQWNILHSPRLFGEFAAKKTLETIPQR